MSLTAAKPPTLDDLLSEFRHRRWTMIRWGRLESPELMAVMYNRKVSADVLILWRENYASAYRTPIIGDSPVLCPPVVNWQYHADPWWTARALLSLSEPGTPGAPMGIEDPSPHCWIPPGLPKPVVTRPLGLT